MCFSKQYSTLWEWYLSSTFRSACHRCPCSTPGCLYVLCSTHHSPTPVNVWTHPWPFQWLVLLRIPALQGNKQSNCLHVGNKNRLDWVYKITQQEWGFFSFSSGSHLWWHVSLPFRQTQKQILNSRHWITSTQLSLDWGSLYFVSTLSWKPNTSSQGGKNRSWEWAFIFIAIINKNMAQNKCYMVYNEHPPPKMPHSHVIMFNVGRYLGLPGNMFWSFLTTLIIHYEGLLCGI